MKNCIDHLIVLEMIRNENDAELISDTIRSIGKSFDISCIFGDLSGFRDVIWKMLGFLSINSKNVIDSIFNFLDHWIPIVVSYRSYDFIKLCEYLTLEDISLRSIVYLLPYLSVALNLQPDGIQKQYISLCSRLLFASNNNERMCVFPALWSLFVKYSDEPTIRALIETIHTTNLAFSVAILVQKNPETLIPPVLSSRSFEFLVQFFNHLRVSSPYSIIDLSSRIIQSYNEEEHDDTLLSLLPVFIKSINWKLNDEEMTDMKRIWGKVVEVIKSNRIKKKERNDLLNILLIATSKSFFDSNDFKDLLSFYDDGSEAMKSLKIKAAFRVFGCADFTMPMIETLFSSRLGSSYKVLLTEISLSISQLSKTNTELCSYFIKQIADPLPREKIQQSIIAKILSLVPKTVLLDSNIDIHQMISTLISTHAYDICYDVYRISKKFSFQIPYHDLDLFDDIHGALILRRSIKPEMLFELLDYRMISIKDFYLVFKSLRYSIRSCLPGLFDCLLCLLGRTLKIMGYMFVFDSFESKQNEEHQWVADDSIFEFFNSINTLIHLSTFGKYVSGLLKTIKQIVQFYNLTKSDIANLVSYCEFLAPMFPDIALSFILSLIPKINSFEDTDLTLILRSTVSRLLHVPYPAKYSQYIFLLSLNTNGFDQSVMDCYDILINAAMYNRECAQILCNFLKQPLPLLRTFLSFRGSQQHTEWVLRCSKEISPSEWIVLPDEDLSDFPQYSIITKASQPEKSLRASEFSLIPISNLCIYPSIHTGFPGTLSLLESFLFYSNQTLPYSLTFNDAEEISLKNPHRIRLMIGVLNYSIRFSETIQKSKWASLLSTFRVSYDSMLLVSLYFANEKFDFMSPPKYIIPILHWCFKNFEIEHNKDSIIKFYIRSVGIERFMIRNLILTDPSFFKSLTCPLPDIERSEIFESCLVDALKANSSNQDYILYCLNCVIEKYSDNSMLQSHSNLPSNTSWPPFLLDLVPRTKPPKSLRIPNSILECLISIVGNNDYILRLIVLLDINNDQFISLKSAIMNRYKRYVLLPSLRVAETKEWSVQHFEFFSHRSPSFACAFFRSLMKQFSPPINQQIVEKISTFLSTVHPALAPIISKGIVNTISPASPLDSLILHKPSSGFGLICQKALEAGQIQVYEAMSSLSDNDLMTILPWTSSSLPKYEITKLVLYSLSETQNFTNLLSFIPIALKTISIEHMLSLICCIEYVQFPKAFIVSYACLYKILRKLENPLVDFLTIFKDEITTQFHIKWGNLNKSWEILLEKL